MSAVILEHLNYIGHELIEMANGLSAGLRHEAGRQARYKAKDLYALRRKRDQLFDPAVFGEPCWDVMLDLYEAERTGKPVCVSSACVAASVPPTTALRWLNVLESVGYVERSPDPADARRSFLHLTADTRSKLKALLGE